MAGLSNADSVHLYGFSGLGFFTPVHLACFSRLLYKRREIATTEEILLLSMLLKDMDQEDNGLQGIQSGY